jgi:hypothetical protein
MLSELFRRYSTLHAEQAPRLVRKAGWHAISICSGDFVKILVNSVFIFSLPVSAKKKISKILRRPKV